MGYRGLNEKPPKSPNPPKSPGYQGDLGGKSKKGHLNRPDRPKPRALAIKLIKGKLYCVVDFTSVEFTFGLVHRLRLSSESNLT